MDAHSGTDSQGKVNLLFSYSTVFIEALRNLASAVRSI